MATNWKKKFRAGETTSPDARIEELQEVPFKELVKLMNDPDPDWTVADMSAVHAALESRITKDVLDMFKDTGLTFGQIHQLLGKIGEATGSLVPIIE